MTARSGRAAPRPFESEEHVATDHALCADRDVFRDVEGDSPGLLIGQARAAFSRSFDQSTRAGREGRGRPPQELDRPRQRAGEEQAAVFQARYWTEGRGVGRSRPRHPIG